MPLPQANEEVYMPAQVSAYRKEIVALDGVHGDHPWQPSAYMSGMHCCADQFRMCIGNDVEMNTTQE